LRMRMKILSFVLIAAASVVMFAVSIKLYNHKETELLSYYSSLNFGLALGASAALILVYLMLDLKSAKTKRKIAALLPIIFLMESINLPSATAVEHSALQHDLAGSFITPKT